jgi:hypothetical protein
MEIAGNVLDKTDDYDEALKNSIGLLSEMKKTVFDPKRGQP